MKHVSVHALLFSVFIGMTNITVWTKAFESVNSITIIFVGYKIFTLVIKTDLEMKVSLTLAA